MKSLLSLCILLLCAACLPQGLPAAEPSPTFIATPSFVPTSQATSPSFPTSGFAISTDNVVIDQQGQIYVSGERIDARYFARWDGAKWISLGHGLPNWNNALTVDSAGQLYALAAQGETEIMQWDGASWKNINGNLSAVVDALQAGRVSGNFNLREVAVDREDQLYVSGSFPYQSADSPDERSMGFVAKWDGDTWLVLGQGLDRVNLLELAVSAAGRVYVAGENQSPGGESCYLAQWEGKTWTQISMSKLGSKLDNIGCGLAVDKSERLYVSGRFQDHTAGFIARWDGVDWTMLTEQVDDFVSDMAADAKGGLYIGGYFESVDGIRAQHIAYWDGSVWRALGGGLNGRVKALAFDPGGELYASREFTQAGGLPADSIAHWDGETWHTLSPPVAEPYPTPSTAMFETAIENVAIGQQDQLYASGFSKEGNDLRWDFARWDGTEWMNLGSGNGFDISYDSLVTDEAGHLYGVTTTTSKEHMKAIIRWDGAKVEDITGNFGVVVDALRAGRLSANIPVAALAVDAENNLYAAGSFSYPNTDQTGKLSMGYVAKWDQETWTVLGQGLDRIDISALAVSRAGKVYVAGEDQSTGGGVSYVGQWDGKTWTRLNTNKLESTVHNLAVDTSERLYVSGTLSDKKELVARWEDGDWTILPGQLDGYAVHMAVAPNGDLYIGGSFEAVGGVAAHNITYWDGSAWHALGEGVNGAVFALAFSSSGELYASGIFSEAGGLPVPHIARWDGETWHPLGP